MNTASTDRFFRWKPDHRIDNHYIFHCWDDPCELPGIAIVKTWKWDDLALRRQVVAQMLAYGINTPREGDPLNFEHQIELGRFVGLGDQRTAAAM